MGVPVIKEFDPSILVIIRSGNVTLEAAREAMRLSVFTEQVEEHISSRILQTRGFGVLKVVLPAGFHRRYTGTVRDTLQAAQIVVFIAKRLRKRGQASAAGHRFHIWDCQQHVHFSTN